MKWFFVLLIGAVTAYEPPLIQPVYHVLGGLPGPYSSGPANGDWVTAEAALKPGSDPNVQGFVSMRQRRTGGPVYLTAHITGLSPGLHGFHVHEKGDTGDNCLAAGPHFNPHKHNHGAPTDEHRHAGDLGNVKANEQGEVTFRLEDHYISLVEGDTNVVGRAFVVHEKPDDLGRGGNEESLKTGNAGKRLACGVIYSS